ncbi:transcriptional repressor [Ketobacter alkanivorans]|uniref:Transcriptional repressor n=1 Tax=Ketobacter alkanivorans TaxID=1917421 RepID=A0A2K9LRA4_9GAMM|nr:transcriptional repressor [Ketobacter alkanivorans]AUM13344.1 transcriptional repressor [Ketobacter alkanivorans]
MNATKLKKNLTRAEQNCIAHGVRLTTKRKHILQLLLQSDTPLSAYELATHYNETFNETIPAMSVYRMLDFLVAEGLVHKLNSANKYVACAHITCDHSHEVPQFLICARCQSVKEVGISPDIIEALEASVAQAGYLLTQPQIELHCLCERCVQAA